MARITHPNLIPTVGQCGFWYEQQRVSKLQEKKPVLKRLSEWIPWELFRPLLDQDYEQERRRNAGRKRIDPLILFKMLVLQQLFNISDEELEFQVNDRRSFECLATMKLAGAATSSMACWVSAGVPGADAQGPGDAGITDESSTQAVYGETTRWQQPKGCCRSGAHLSAQCPPD
jgi:hypothetical protein